MEKNPKHFLTPFDDYFQTITDDQTFAALSSNKRPTDAGDLHPPE